MSFNSLKSTSASLTQKLQAQIKKQSSNGRETDERFWKPTPDAVGNAYALIRFLPPAPNKNVEGGVEEAFYIKIHDHGFKGPTGKWYIEKSLSTIDQKDPVGEYNSILWAKGTEAAKKVAQAQKRRTKFYSNILVIEDPANPKNNGKVFLYSYGKKIFDKINDKMNPQFPDEQSVNPFDFWAGANFKLKQTKVENFPNYDKSEFSDVSPLFEDDSKIEAVWNKQYPLMPFLDPSEFKTYKQLKARMNEVLGITDDTGDNPRAAYKDETPSEEDESMENEAVDDTPVLKNPAPAATLPEAEPEDELEFFKSFTKK